MEDSWSQLDEGKFDIVKNDEYLKRLEELSRQLNQEDPKQFDTIKEMYLLQQEYHRWFRSCLR